MIKHTFLSVLGLYFIAFSANAQHFEAKVSRTEIPYGETLMLVLDYDGNDDNLYPDFSVLEDDFTTFSTSQSFSTQIINGKRSSSRQWQVALMPNKSGALTIPAIPLGQHLKSNPIALNVFEGNINGQDGTPLYTRFSLEGDIEPKEAYVQQQINYTLTLLDAGGLQGNEPEFIGNENGDWIIKQIHQPTVDVKNIDGVNTREIKFYYALFPQRSGLIKTPKVQFNGFHNIADQNAGNKNGIFAHGGFFDVGVDIFDMAAIRSPISLNVKPVELEIKPIAPEFNDKWWLPAKDVKLKAAWNEKNPKFKVGEVVERTIYLMAVGVLDTQLPDIKPAQNQSVKQYPEKPVQSSVIDENGNLVSVKQFVNTYIPQKAGKITIPEISVAWFDTNENKVKTATIEAEDIFVEPNPEFMRETSDVKSETVADKKAENEYKAKAANITTYAQYGAVLIAFLSGLLLAYVLFGRKNTNVREKPAEYSPKDIEKFSDNADFRNLRDALIVWGQKRFNDDNITDLNVLSEKIGNKEFSTLCKTISKNLYGNSAEDWDAKEFSIVFAKIKKQKNKAKKSDEPLPKLYKNKM